MGGKGAPTLCAAREDRTTPTAPTYAADEQLCALLHAWLLTRCKPCTKVVPGAAVDDCRVRDRSADGGQSPVLTAKNSALVPLLGLLLGLTGRYARHRSARRNLEAMPTSPYPVCTAQRRRLLRERPCCLGQRTRRILGVRRDFKIIFAFRPFLSDHRVCRRSRPSRSGLPLPEAPTDLQVELFSSNGSFRACWSPLPTRKTKSSACSGCTHQSSNSSPLASRSLESRLDTYHIRIRCPTWYLAGHTQVHQSGLDVAAVWIAVRGSVDGHYAQRMPRSFYVRSLSTINLVLVIFFLPVQ